MTQISALPLQPITDASPMTQNPVTEAPGHLEIEGIRKRYCAFLALGDISIQVRRGELFCLPGPSGYGKSTRLTAIGGLIIPDPGVIRLNGRDITDTPMQKRNAGIVFQGYALFVHMTLRANIAFGMRVRTLPEAQIRQRVNTLLEMTRMTGKEDRCPRQLSGGEQQRVAIARVRATNPGLLLLDEPFSNLDAKLRIELRSEVHRMQREAGISMIVVTHDQEEAFSLGDRLALLARGSVMQEVFVTRDSGKTVLLPQTVA